MWKCDCRFLPHGLYSLLPSTLSLMAFWVTIVQDGCDYAKLVGPSVEDITESDIIPYLEVGFAKPGYRAPLYYANDEEWKMVYTNECKDYPSSLGEPDSLWNMAKWCTLLSSIFGLSGTLFLWFTVCFAYSARTWRLCAVQLLLASLTRLGTIGFLFTDMCTSDGSSCSLHFGSQCDILASTLWFVSAVMIFGHYPTPKLKSLTEKEFIEQTLQEQQEALNALQDHDSRSVVSGATRSIYSSAKRLAGGSSNKSVRSFASRGGGGDDQSFYTKDQRSFYTKGGDDRTYYDDKSFYTKGGDDRTYYDDKSFYTKGGDDRTYYDDKSFYTKGGDDRTYYDDKSFYTKGGDDRTYYTNADDQQTRYTQDGDDDGHSTFV